MKYFVGVCFSIIFLIGCEQRKIEQKKQPLKTAIATRWTEEKANAWEKEKGWLVGSNFNPSTAINQLEMWQAESFDTVTIDRELGWAENLGFNSMRVFLHNLLWEQDSTGFKQRLDKCLEISSRHKIGTVFVLFDGVWDPHPKLGKQRMPNPHVHNSGWVQSPGVEILKDTLSHDQLRGYVKGILRYLSTDKRVDAWDLFNEPDNMNNPAYIKNEPLNKADLSLVLLKKAFLWAREVNPTQPITAGVWLGEWGDSTKIKPMDKFMLDNSDIITFHNYDGPDVMEQRIEILKKYNRPVLCTEYMARGNNSTFEGVLPVLKKHHVAAYNWGFVNGKTQTIYPWDSWKKKYSAAPQLWFHDIFYSDGQPYSKQEVDFIKALCKDGSR